MCVVAIAWEANPKWRLLVAGNRDEFHSRPSAPLHRWDDGSGIIAGRDLVSGGSWMGVSKAGQFAVVTNIRNPDGPNHDKASRGALVTDWLADHMLPGHVECFNPFNLIATDRESIHFVSSWQATTKHPISAGIHGLSNAVPDERWPRKDRLVAHLSEWLSGTERMIETLLDLLSEETVHEPNTYPIFIRSPIYGTRCSTVVAVDYEGQGTIIERRFDGDGKISGEAAIAFVWPN